MLHWTILYVVWYNHCLSLSPAISLSPRCLVYSHAGSLFRYPLHLRRRCLLLCSLLLLHLLFLQTPLPNYGLCALTLSNSWVHNTHTRRHTRGTWQPLSYSSVPVIEVSAGCEMQMVCDEGALKTDTEGAKLSESILIRCSNLSPKFK